MCSCWWLCLKQQIISQHVWLCAAGCELSAAQRPNVAVTGNMASLQAHCRRRGADVPVPPAAYAPAVSIFQFTRILVLTPSWSIFSASSATERSPTVPPVWEERPPSEDWSRWKQISRRRFSSDRMIPITETAVIRIHGDQGPQGVQMLLTVYSMEADRCRKQINNANSKTNTKMQKKKKNAATAENRSK